MLTSGVPALRALPALAGASLLILTGCQSTPDPVEPADDQPAQVAHVSLDPLDRLGSFNPDREAWARVGYRLDWRAVPPLGQGDRFIELDLLGDDVAVQSNDSTLSLLDAANGSVRNSNQLADHLATLTGNFRLGQYVVSSTSYDAFFVEPVTGNLVSRYPYGAVLGAKPLVFEGLVIGATTEGVLFAKAPTSGGFTLWRFGTRDPIDVPPVRVGSSIAAVTRTGKLVIVDGASGRLVGTNSMFDGCGTTPVASDETVFVGSLDQSIYAFSALDARMLWRVRTAAPIRQQPTYANGVLYVGTEDRGMLALDGATGAELWAAQDVRGEVLTERSGRLFVWDGLTATVLDPETGDVVDQVDLPGVRDLQGSSYEDGELYAVSDHGVVAKFVPWQ